MYKRFTHPKISEAVNSIQQQVHSFIDELVTSRCYGTRRDTSIVSAFRSLFDYDPGMYTNAARSLGRCSSIQSFFISTLPELLFESPLLRNFLVSSTPLCHIVSRSISLDTWYTGYPGHKDWFSVRGSKSTITAWLPVYYSTPQPIHSLGFYSPKNRELISQVKGNHGFELDVVDDAYEEFICELGSVILFDGFQPHKSMTTKDGFRNTDDLRVAFSFRYEFIDDPEFIDRGFTNNYRLVSESSDDYTVVDLGEDGGRFASHKLLESIE